MHDEELNNQDAREMAGIVERYEAMISSDAPSFFDLMELESLIEHYLQQGRHRKAQHVLKFASGLYPESLSLQLREAQLMAGTGNVRLAIPRLRNLLAFEPTNDEIHLTLATLYSQLDQHQEAIHHYRQALDLGDAIFRGDLFIDIALEYENIGHWEHAIEVLKEALQENPENETALHELGFCYESMGQSKEAIGAFQQFVDDHPYSCAGWYNLGNALQRVGEHSKAIESYEFSLVIDDGFSPALLQKASALTMMEDYDQALECYRESMLMDAPQANIYTLMGECKERVGSLNEAEEYYLCALELDGDFADAHVGLGVVAEMREDWTGSLKHFERAMALEPENVEYHILLGGILKKIGMHDEAGLIYANALRLEPENLEVHLEAAENLQADDRHEEALELLDSVPPASTEDPLVICRRFISLYSLGRTKTAFSVLDLGIERAHDLCQILLGLFPGIDQDAEFSLRALNAQRKS